MLADSAPSCPFRPHPHAAFPVQPLWGPVGSHCILSPPATAPFRPHPHSTILVWSSGASTARTGFPASAANCPLRPNPQSAFVLPLTLAELRRRCLRGSYRRHHDSAPRNLCARGQKKKKKSQRPGNKPRTLQPPFGGGGKDQSAETKVEVEVRTQGAGLKRSRGRAFEIRSLE